MKLEGVVHNGVIVPDDSQVLSEGTRVRIEPVNAEKKATFGELFGDLVKIRGVRSLFRQCA